MNNRTLRTIVVHDPNSAESRKMMEDITADMNVDVIELQRVSHILPGVRAVPAIGLVMWPNDMQGIATDVNEFSTYIKNEHLIRGALQYLGIDTIGNEISEQACDLANATRTAARYLPDNIAVTFPPQFYIDWNCDSTDYVTDDLRLYNNDLYRCRGNHTSDAEHNPVNAPSLWRKLEWASKD